jgi:hypothetical protein
MECPRKRPPQCPLKTIRTLLDQGAHLHAQSVRGYTTLDGLCLNLVQLDGRARRHQHLSSRMETWLNIVEDLGFSARDYIRREATLHENMCHDLGLGLHMEFRFDEDTAPWIWSAFQGPEERERGEYVDQIDKCSIWPEWHRTYTLTRPPPRRRPAKLLRGTTEIVVIKGSIGASEDILEILPTAEFQYPNPRNTVNIPPHLLHLYLRARYRIDFASKFRWEFSLYIALILSFLGLRCFARLCGTTIFFMVLKCFEDTALY